MDEIKSVIQDLPAEDIMILKAIYNPDVARAEMSEEWQRVSALLDWLTPEEQQEAVNVEPAEALEPEVDNPTPETWEAPVEEMAQEAVEQQLPEWTTSAWSLEDYLI